MAGLSRGQRLVIGTFVLLLVDFLWVASAELTRYLFKGENFNKPFFSTYVKTTMFMIYLLGFLFHKPWRNGCKNKQPLYRLVNLEEQETDTNMEPVMSDSTWVPVKFNDGGDRSSGTESEENGSIGHNRSVRFSKLTEVRQLADSQAEDALLARLSYQATLQAHEAAYRAANKLPVIQVARIAFMFCFLWFLGNFGYQQALVYTEAGVVNVLSCTSGLFTLLLASFFPSNSGDRFTLSKLVAVLTSIAGVVIITSSSKQNINSYFPSGAIWSLIGALFYALYIVLLRHKVDSETKIDIPMFFGFVGLFNMIVMWPGFLLLHYLEVEVFSWPSAHQWYLIVVNGALGTVFSELLWLWGCFLTSSSLLATLAISLTIPVAILYDVFFKKVHYPLMFYVGIIPMFASFVSVTYLAHWDNWDPALVGLCKLVGVCTASSQRARNLRIQDVDKEQSESLISVDTEFA